MSNVVSEIVVETVANKKDPASQQLTSKAPQKDAPNLQKHAKFGAFILPTPDVALDYSQELERKRQKNLIGQLKAAESHNKIHNMRLRYRKMRAAEINHLILSQPTARQAIRLEALLPPWQEKIHFKDTLDKLEVSFAQVKTASPSSMERDKA
ncbi:protein LKAAEAR1 [Rhincodon typus]|uniref:protein LKAAEAR1 n=1 Tax=Rhincodon typus TaxID=259920 RepID=UPI00203091A9|nr:protein LKAAEAR1 [Rhincodon typus]